MDPLSITASCIGITAAIATLTERITTFVSSVREARKDLDAVRRELGSLQLSLSALSDEEERFGFDRTPPLKDNLLGVLSNCGGIVDEIKSVLEGMETEDGNGNGRLGVAKKLKWATTGKGQMAKLRLGLEAHKSALDIALDLIAISITADIKQDTSALREDTGKIKEDTDQILLEIGNLQTQVAQLDVSHDRGFMMQRFLDSSVNYAESVANLDEFEPEFEVLEAVPEESPAFLKERPARSEPQPLETAQGITSPGLAPSNHAEGATPPGSRPANRYWSSLPQKERDALLFEAAEHGNLKRISLLLDSGANIDARNEAGKTPICVVIDRGHHSCLELLLDNGASMDKIGTGPCEQHAFIKAHHLQDIKSLKMIIDSGPKSDLSQRLYNHLAKALSDESRGKLSQKPISLDNYDPNTFLKDISEGGASISDLKAAQNVDQAQHDKTAKKSYPPASVSNAAVSQDGPRSSMDSRRSTSLGFGKKRSGSMTRSETTLSDKPRRFSLLPASFSLEAIGIGKDEYNNSRTTQNENDDREPSPVSAREIIPNRDERVGSNAKNGHFPPGPPRLPPGFPSTRVWTWTTGGKEHHLRAEIVWLDEVNLTICLESRTGLPTESEVSVCWADLSPLDMEYVAAIREYTKELHSIARRKAKSPDWISSVGYRVGAGLLGAARSTSVPAKFLRKHGDA